MIRIVFVWKVFGSKDVEAMTCKDEWLGASGDVLRGFMN